MAENGSPTWAGAFFGALIGLAAGFFRGHYWPIVLWGALGGAAVGFLAGIMAMVASMPSHRQRPLDVPSEDALDAYIRFYEGILQVGGRDALSAALLEQRELLAGSDQTSRERMGRIIDEVQARLLTSSEQRSH